MVPALASAYDEVPLLLTIDLQIRFLNAARDTDLGRFADWPDPERIVGNLHRAYAELDGTPRGGPIDIMAALADMVTYNGGKPLTCLA